MRRLGLGEMGEVTFTRSSAGYLAAAYYRNYQGRRVRERRTGRTKAEARQRLVDAVTAELAKDCDADLGPASAFALGLDGWMEYVDTLVKRGRRSPTTAALYRSTIERYVRDAFGELRCAEVTTPRVDRFLTRIYAERGFATAKVCRTVLSGACGWLVRQGAMSANPVREVTPLEAARTMTPRALGEDEVWRWLDLVDNDPVACRRDLPDLVRLLLATGVRVGEALAVTWADVDLTAGTVAVDHTIVRVKGQGLVRTRPKSVAGNRTLVLPVWAVEMLRARRIASQAFEGPVFPSVRGTFRDPSNVSRAFREVREGSDLDWVRSHTFRKTLATLLDGAGTSARVVADQLGHSRVSMTQDVYFGRRAVSRAAADVVERFGGRASAGGE